MYISSICCDDWVGLSSEHKTVENPTWADVEAPIRALDGARRTVVALEGEGEKHLCVGGGSLGRYCIYATFDNERFFTLAFGDQPETAVMLNVGGQEGDYPSNTIGDIATVLVASKRLLRPGK